MTAEKSDKEIGGEFASTSTTFHDESTHRHLQNGKITAYTVDKKDDTKEERGWLPFQGLSKLKNLLKGKPKSVANLQKNPSVVKEVENFKVDPAMINQLKEDPVMMKRLETLAKNTAAVKSLQKAPTERNVMRVRAYLSRGHSRGTPDDAKALLALSLILLIFIGGPVGLATLIIHLYG